MTQSAPTISIRLPEASRKSLDKAAKVTRRSRSFLMKEALDRYLNEIVREESARKAKPLSNLLSMAGAGADFAQRRTGEEINAHVRWLRDDE
jgi:RHH-type transcriptional regulator, rel operon repressor / antitoxin RelB